MCKIWADGCHDKTAGNIIWLMETVASADTDFSLVLAGNEKPFEPLSLTAGIALQLTSSTNSSIWGLLTLPGRRSCAENCRASLTVACGTDKALFSVLA